MEPDDEIFCVRPTTVDQRRTSMGEYIVAVDPALRARLGLGAAAVVHNRVTDGATTRVLRMHARVVDGAAHDDGTVAVDQTLRNAIGIPFSYDDRTVSVGIAPLDVPRHLRLLDRMNRLLGRRYLVLRVAKGDMADMEKDMVRIRPDAFALLGCGVSSKVVLESAVEEHGRYVLRRRSIRAYEWSGELDERRRSMMRPGLGERFPDPEVTLGVSPDLAQIYMDAYARSILGVESLDPIRVRRNLWNAFLREFREFGTVFFISLFGLTQIIPGEITWRVSAIVLAVGLVIALCLTLVNLRARGSS